MSFVWPRRVQQHGTGGSAARPFTTPVQTGPMTACWRGLLFYGCLGLLGAALLVGCTLSAALARALPARLRPGSGRLLISGCTRGFFRVASALRLVELELSTLDALNDQGGVIIAPNHPSMLDALLIASRVQRTGCIMKSDLRNNPFLGAGARLAGYIGNDSVPGMMRQAITDLRSGGKLLIFPEATRSSTPASINPMTAGIAFIAQRAGVPIQTVLIETDSPYLSKGWPLQRLPRLPLRYRVTLGPRFVVGADRKHTLAEMHRFYAASLAAPDYPSVDAAAPCVLPGLRSPARPDV